MANIIKQLIDSDGNNIYPIAYAQGGVKMDLLITTTNTSDYSGGTVSIDLADYDMCVIEAYGTNSVKEFYMVLKGGTTRMTTCSFQNFYRDVTMSDTGLVFGKGYTYNNYKTNTASENTYAPAPHRIFGIKFSWIVPTTVQGLQYIEV